MKIQRTFNKNQKKIMDTDKLDPLQIKKVFYWLADYLSSKAADKNETKLIQDLRYFLVTKGYKREEFTSFYNTVFTLDRFKSFDKKKFPEFGGNSVECTLSNEYWQMKVLFQKLQKLGLPKIDISAMKDDIGKELPTFEDLCIFGKLAEIREQEKSKSSQADQSEKEPTTTSEGTEHKSPDNSSSGEKERRACIAFLACVTAFGWYKVSKSMKTSLPDGILLVNRINKISEEQIPEINKNISKVQTQINEMKKDMNKGMQAQTDVMKTQIHEEMQMQIGGMQTQMNGMQTQINKMQTQVNEVKTQVNEVKAQMNGMQAQIDKMQTQVNEVKTQVNEVKAQMNGMQTQINKMQTHVNEVKTQVNEVKAQMNGMQAQIDKMQTQMNENQKTTNEKLDKILKYINNNESNNDKIDILEKTVSSMTKIFNYIQDSERVGI